MQLGIVLELGDVLSFKYMVGTRAQTKKESGPSLEMSKEKSS